MQGTTFTSPDNTTFYTWRHIPYAKPPLNELRFLPPVSPDPWSGILDGANDSLACLFVGSYVGDPVPTYGYSEDCLYINVYSPFLANSSLNLPVMFYIYGGGFKVGSGDFSFTDPTPLLLHDVIVVTFNYRLDIFGFLSTGDEVLSGNTALKDQLAALIWTRNNIAFFGGDPTKITIFGNSAGAMSVGYHLVSPRSRDLFTGAIMESGTALFADVQTTPKKNALFFAQQVNSTLNESSSSELIVQVLQAADAELLVTLSLASQTDNSTMFFPVIELENATAFLSKPMYESFWEGNFSMVPVIIGVNSEEAIDDVDGIEEAEEYAAYADSNLTVLLPSTMPLIEGANITDITQNIREAYVGNSNFSDNPAQIIKLMSDDLMVRSSMKQAILQSNYTPVYFYQFSFVGTRSESWPIIPGCGRVAHADELGYVFNISTKPIATAKDYLTRTRMIKLWTNFAKTQNPTPEDDLSAEILQNVTWTRFDSDNLQYLDIGDDLELKYGLKANVTRFWSYLWNTYSYHPYNTF